MSGDEYDEGFTLGAKETVAGTIITGSVSAYILQSDLPFLHVFSEYEVVVWAFGGIGVALAVMVLWVRQTNQM